MANNLVNIDNLSTAFGNFHKEKYSHCVIDNFLNEDVADKIATEFFAHDSDLFNGNYNNQIELKRTCNIWDRFPASIYQLITYLNSTSFIDVLSNHTGHSRLYSDPGIHGGGLHSHPNGGKLNPHRDYSLHPKLGLQRKYNLLIYITPNWQKEWGGDFGIWDSNEAAPTHLIKQISPIFNRAVFFDTTQTFWHGLATTVSCPLNISRNSLATYYLTDSSTSTDTRNRALFAPTEDQKNDLEVLDLIKRRSIAKNNNVEQWDRS
jgi:Rps23 Pro-64 3,4-dihydroxylase Tpa1-like proline 4-hydroxylase